jgi:hypothetical protein
MTHSLFLQPTIRDAARHACGRAAVDYGERSEMLNQTLLTALLIASLVIGSLQHGSS